MIVKDGELNRRLMRRELMTDDELLTQLPLDGIDGIAAVRRALLGPNGMVSVVRADDTTRMIPCRTP